MAGDKELEVVVQSSRGSKTFTFAKQTKVSEVINAAVQAFGFSAGDSFLLVLASNPNDPLQPERPLISYHVADGTVLILTAVGSGV